MKGVRSIFLKNFIIYSLVVMLSFTALGGAFIYQVSRYAARERESALAAAVNRVAANRGGIVVMEGGRCLGEVVLAIAGLMSDDTLENVNRDLENAKSAAFQLGVSREIDPFMTLSFMSLPVIPTLRLTTRGVIDVLKQQYI